MAEPRILIGAERRVHTRNDYGGTLQLQCVGDATWFAVYGRDVSAGGFSFFTDVPLARGERINVSTPEIEMITFPATVRHIRPVPESEAGGESWLVGVEFDEPLPDPVVQCLGRW